VVNLAARLCASAADREILMDVKVAEAIQSRHPLIPLGPRPVKGYEEDLLVFRISVDEWSANA
jgi:class 3 adenylate cyclase